MDKWQNQSQSHDRISAKITSYPAKIGPQWICAKIGPTPHRNIFFSECIV